MNTMRRRLSLIAVLPLLGLSAACDGPPPWATDTQEEAPSTRSDFGPMAAYERLLLFVGPGEEVPTAAVFDFAAIRDSAGFRRGVRARLLEGEEWAPLMDAGWEMEPMREPWRLVPHGPLSVLVGDEGELDALVYQAEPAVRLDPGAVLAEYTPDGGTQLVLRQGRLRIGEDAFAGIILDNQHGRPLRRAPETASTAGDTLAGPERERDEPTTADTASNDADASSANASPSARPGVEGILLDNSGYYAVFAPSGNGELAWLQVGGQSEVRRGTRLEAAEWEQGDDPERVPVRWTVSSPEGALAGDIRAVSGSHIALPARADVTALDYVVVAGWIQDREVRREVYGLIRHVR